MTDLGSMVLPGQRLAKSSEICVGRLVALSSGALLESQEHKAPKPITHSDNQNNFLILITIKN